MSTHTLHERLPDAGAVPHQILDARPPALWHVLRDTALGSAASAITLDRLPVGYAQWRLHLYARSSVAAERDTISLTLNGDSGAHYDAMTVAFDDPITQLVTVDRGATGVTVAACEGANSRASTASPVVVAFHRPTDGAWERTGAFGGVCFGDRSADADVLAGQGWWTWRSTARIATVTLTMAAGAFVAGSRATLWGLRVA